MGVAPVDLGFVTASVAVELGAEEVAVAVCIEGVVDALKGLGIVVAFEPLVDCSLVEAATVDPFG